MPNLVCYCFRVEKTRIVEAIEEGCGSVEALSARLRVATGCGGCRPDLEDLLRFYAQERPRDIGSIPASPDPHPPAATA